MVLQENCRINKLYILVYKLYLVGNKSSILVYKNDTKNDNRKSEYFIIKKRTTFAYVLGFEEFHVIWRIA